MSSLIESLVNAPLTRHDAARLSMPKRPPPVRLREVFELFGALAATASFQSLNRSLDMRNTEPGILANVVLGRWPSDAELAALAEDYSAARHLRAMLLSEEFRRHLPRRIMDEFPEKRRLLHIRVPGCATRHVAALISCSSPFIPENTGGRTYANPEILSQMLGRLFANVNTARSIGMSSPTMAPLVDPPVTALQSADPLSWHLSQPPYRAIDLLFAVIRSPQSLALSQANGTLMAIRDDPGAKPLARLSARLGPLPSPAQPGAWKRLARQLLHQALPRNPVCTALGDGTAAGALAACARVPVELVAIEKYPEWARPSLDPALLPPIGATEPFLAPGDLTAQDHAAIQDRMAEDIIFHDRFAKVIAATGLASVRGARL